MSLVMAMELWPSRFDTTATSTPAAASGMPLRG
jgi:hypothetical protein